MLNFSALLPMNIKNSAQLKEFRESLGLSQREFASLIDRDDGLVSKWETGKSPIPDYLEERVAKLVKKPGMDYLRIRGGKALNGTIQISGAKNSALKLMCAALLSAEPLHLKNMPNQLRDIRSQTDLLRHLGCTVLAEGNRMMLNASNITDLEAPYDLVRKMRTSILVLGPLLARFHEARVSLPGGCAIGTRPVDMHIDGLRALGAEIELDQGYIIAKAPGGLKGGKIEFAKVSVGATENLMMAATLATGETILGNAAREPEIVDLGECLIAMGAQIEGLGTSEIRIRGVKALHSALHDVVPDRIETGTWMIAVTLTGGKLRLKNARAEHLDALVAPLQKAGAKIERDGADIIVSRSSAPLVGTDIITEPYPGFPTDLQAQFMTMLTFCEGAGMVTETIFENRFMHVPELCRMGANITVHGSSAIVRGVPKLKGAEVMATDLRASVALVLAGLVAEGETVVNRIYHLDRGYENIVQKLGGCGADIERLQEGGETEG
jgi:UDP-N-acetylglucosamine 1-carboxyvinyltransferase